VITDIVNGISAYGAQVAITAPAFEDSSIQVANPNDNNTVATIKRLSFYCNAAAIMICKYRTYPFISPFAAVSIDNLNSDGVEPGIEIIGVPYEGNGNGIVRWNVDAAGLFIVPEYDLGMLVYPGSVLDVVSDTSGTDVTFNVEWEERKI